MAIRVVRLGTPRQDNEGLRLGTVRRPPRGVRKEDFGRRDYFDVWVPELAPSASLVSWAVAKPFTPQRWATFARRYRAEMRKPTAQHLITLLAALSARQHLSVGCYCADESRCHRSVLRELLHGAGAVMAEPQGSDATEDSRLLTPDSRLPTLRGYHGEAIAAQLGGYPAGLGRTLWLRAVRGVHCVHAHPPGGHGGSAGAGPGGAAGSLPFPAHTVIDGVAYTLGAHLCGLFASEVGRIKQVIGFLEDGLRPGTVCFYVAPDQARADVLAQLEKSRPSVRTDLAAGRLVLPDFMPSPRAQLEYFETSMGAALRAGAHTLRVVGDVSGLGPKTEEEGLLEFEAKYEEVIAKRFPLVTLCQYDVHQFSGVTILNALKLHRDTFRYPVDRVLG